LILEFLYIQVGRISSA